MYKIGDIITYNFPSRENELGVFIGNDTSGLPRIYNFINERIYSYSDGDMIKNTGKNTKLYLLLI